MDISKRIIVIFVAVSLVPILVISALSGYTIFDVSNNNANDSAAALQSEELDNLGRISNDTALFIDERWQQYFDGVFMMEDYCEDLFNDRINATPQYSYFWNPIVEGGLGHTVPGITAAYEEIYDSTQISFDVSCYYMPRADYPSGWTPGDPFDWTPTTQYFLDKSSNMDSVYRSLHEMSSDYIWLYMGFDPTICDTHLFRNYPYDNLEYFLDWYEPGDYDHPTEEWYTNAVSVSGDVVAFTTPYLDPSAGLLVSMGRPVRYDNGTLIGVVSADVTLDTLNTTVASIEVLDSGYAFMLNPNGGVVSHPRYEEEGQSIYQLEFGSEDSAEAVAFQSSLSVMLAGDSDIIEFTKDGERWYLAYTTSDVTGFKVAVVVPVAEVIAPAMNILNLVQTQTLQLTMILGALLAVVAIGVTYASYNKAQAVVKPIKDMTHLVEKMAQQDFTRGIRTSGAMFEEVGTTVDALLSFQEACRFGNQAFIRGDLNRALANYQNLLEISQRLGIEIGEQTMYLNIGNVFRQRGDTGNALVHYNSALEMAKAMLDRAKELGEEEDDALSRIASAYHNIALVEMDRGNFEEAMRFLEDAEVIDMTLGNNRGLAKRYDAMGLVMMKDGRHSQAKSKFLEAIEIARDSDYERSLAYVYYHMGTLYEEQGDWRNAEDSYNDAIALGQRTEELWLVVYAMQRLADVKDHLDKPSHDIRRQSEKLRRSIMFKKSVIFVIDYSGSMRAQNRIKAAIEGAKEILDSQVNPQDEVSIIVFNSDYREVLPLTPKGDYENPKDSPIVRALESLRYPNSATAFYDALGKALEELDSIQSSEHRWIIALTDGEDNSSRRFSLDLLKGIHTAEDRRRKRKPLTIESFIRQRHLDVNLIIIGVGQELAKSVEGGVRSRETGGYLTIEELLDSICGHIPQGQYISVVSTKDVRSDIERAFQQVGVLMAQVEVGGSTLDY